MTATVVSGTEKKKFNLKGILEKAKGLLPKKNAASATPGIKTNILKTIKSKVVAFIVGLTQNRTVFWLGYIMVAIATLYFAFVKGLFYARLGINGQQFVADSFHGQFLQYGEFIMAIVGYLFALPMDTIPGKGKFKEAVGDGMVAVSFFFMFRFGYAFVFSLDIFLRATGGMSGADHAKVTANLPAIWQNAIPVLVILFLIHMLSRKAAPKNP